MELVWMSYFEMVLILLFCIYLVRILYNYFIRKKPIINYRNSFESKRLFVKKYQKEFNYGVIIIIILFVLVCILIVSSNILDLPNVIYKKPHVMNAVAVSNDSNNNIVTKRSVEFKDLNTGEKIVLTLISGPIYSGQCMKIEYFSHIEVGIVVSDLSCENEY